MRFEHLGPSFPLLSINGAVYHLGCGYGFWPGRRARILATSCIHLATHPTHQVQVTMIDANDPSVLYRYQSTTLPSFFIDMASLDIAGIYNPRAGFADELPLVNVAECPVVEPGGAQVIGAAGCVCLVPLAPARART